jgi:hypothetical protein
LTTADFVIREELALKAAILAEKFAPDLSWYYFSFIRKSSFNALHGCFLGIRLHIQLFNLWDLFAALSN